MIEYYNLVDILSNTKNFTMILTNNSENKAKKNNFFRFLIFIEFFLNTI